MKKLLFIVLSASCFCSCTKEELTTTSSIPAEFEPKGVYEIVGTKYQVLLNTNLAHYHILMFGSQLMDNPLQVDSFSKVYLNPDYSMDVYDTTMSIIGEAKFIDTTYNLPKLRLHTGRVLNLKRIKTFYH